MQHNTQNRLSNRLSGIDTLGWVVLSHSYQVYAKDTIRGSQCIVTHVVWAQCKQKEKIGRIKPLKAYWAYPIFPHALLKNKNALWHTLNSFCRSSIARIGKKTRNYQNLNRIFSISIYYNIRRLLHQSNIKKKCSAVTKWSSWNSRGQAHIHIPPEDTIIARPTSSPSFNRVSPVSSHGNTHECNRATSRSVHHRS